MARRRRYDAGKQAVWVDRVRRQHESGRSVRAFCAAEQLKESAFYHWRRELQSRGAIAGRDDGTGNIEACDRGTGRDAGVGGWAEVRVTDTDADGPTGSLSDESGGRVEMVIGASLAIRASVRDAAMLIRELIAHERHPVASAAG